MMIYQSKRILCPIDDYSLSNSEIYERFSENFGSDCFVSFSGCPIITLTRIFDLIQPSISESCFDDARINIGSDCYIESTQLPAFPTSPTKLTCVAIDDGCFGKIYIGDGCVLQGTSICSYELVSIGERVVFGPNVVIMDCSGHALSIRGGNDESKHLNVKPVSIGDDTWIGYGVIILPGVSIGKNVVIGAGSVVCNSIGDNSVAVGNPCVVKYKTHQ